ncbi:MAG: lamin tail domain-containing protein [Sedimenticolaceae bacterium]
MDSVRLAPMALVLLVCTLPARATWISPFISEFHYDNAGSDVGEFVAVSGSPGLDLSGWQIVLYNGANGSPYDALPLSGMLGAGNGLAEVHWTVGGMQNGPDGVALVSAADAVIDFVAYEGAFVATEGLAAGMTARALPIAEGGATPVGSSLQRVGSLADWAWSTGPASPGVVNVGLAAPAQGRVPIAASWLVWLSGLLGLVLATAIGRGRKRGGVMVFTPQRMI